MSQFPMQALMWDMLMGEDEVFFRKLNNSQTNIGKLSQQDREYLCNLVSYYGAIFFSYSIYLKTLSLLNAEPFLIKEREWSTRCINFRYYDFINNKASLSINNEESSLISVSKSPLGQEVGDVISNEKKAVRSLTTKGFNLESDGSEDDCYTFPKNVFLHSNKITTVVTLSPLQILYHRKDIDNALLIGACEYVKSHTVEAITDLTFLAIMNNDVDLLNDLYLRDSFAFEPLSADLEDLAIRTNSWSSVRWLKSKGMYKKVEKDYFNLASIAGTKKEGITGILNEKTDNLIEKIRFSGDIRLLCEIKNITPLDILIKVGENHPLVPSLMRMINE